MVRLHIPIGVFDSVYEHFKEADHNKSNSLSKEDIWLYCDLDQTAFIVTAFDALGGDGERLRFLESFCIIYNLATLDNEGLWRFIFKLMDADQSVRTLFVSLSVFFCEVSFLPTVFNHVFQPCGLQLRGGSPTSSWKAWWSLCTGSLSRKPRFEGSTKRATTPRSRRRSRSCARSTAPSELTSTFTPESTLDKQREGSLEMIISPHRVS